MWTSVQYTNFDLVEPFCLCIHLLQISILKTQITYFYVTMSAKSNRGAFWQIADIMYVRNADFSLQK